MNGSMEQLLRRKLAGAPALRQGLRRGYQRMMRLFTREGNAQGALRRVSPKDGGEWFFGYYDKSPWDASGTRVLCLRADAVDAPAPDAAAGIYLIENGVAARIAETRAWNTQQGCMLQWLGPDFATQVIYNDFRGGQYVSVIYDVDAGCEVRTLGYPVYSVSGDGQTALTLDFSRLHRLRPGYGYQNLPDRTADADCPDTPCVWRIDLAQGDATPILTYAQLRAFEEKASMRGAAHKINHIMINPSGTRFMALHRWLAGGRKHSRLMTFDMDGGKPFTLADEDFVSHCNWSDDDRIISFCRLGGADGYYALRDQTLEHERIWSELTRDGHMSVHGELAVTDTYPDKRRMQRVYLMTGARVDEIARVYAPFAYDGDVRCDLHPRFDRAGTRVMIDATFEGRRALYELPAQVGAARPRVLTVITVPMAYDGPTMSVMRYARAMDRAAVQIDFVAINDAPEGIKGDIAALGGELFAIKGRLRRPIGYLIRLARLVRRGNYDIVHAHGNSCTLAIEMLAAKLGGARVRVSHSRNTYCKFLLAHRLLRPLFDRLYTHAYACGPEAGEWLFGKRPFTVARIAVETGQYAFDAAARARHRAELGAGDSLLIGSVAHFTPHKNHAFLIRMFAELLKVRPDAKLALVGGGALKAEVEELIRALGIEESVILTGVRTDVPALLQAFDVMVLPSLYEGFPNVLIEWQCAGVHAFVSDTVTRAAALTDLVDYLPIDSAEAWVDALRAYNPPADRADISRRAVASVRAQGYDIAENAREMQAFYRAAARGER
ncbi:MAG: glycosyltransferase [Christensenellales bacterium]